MDGAWNYEALRKEIDEMLSVLSDGWRVEKDDGGSRPRDAPKNSG